MKRIELLAPAGDYDCAVSAIQAGCDAIYIGGKRYGARSFALNFDEESLKNIVLYAHERDVLVYVTVNTIIYDDELEDLKEYLGYLEKINVDAIIVQDLGVIKLVKEEFKKLVVHASTQMNISSENGFMHLAKMGVERVVLSREMSLDDLNKINKYGLETEVFIHGSLCFSASGNCLLSSMIGGRSGNRGSCAGPCRKSYNLLMNNQVDMGNKNYLSMKDLMTIDRIPSLIKAGVTSLKIEGRMKKKEYVYTITKHYKEAIDAYYKHENYSLSKDALDDIKVSFNREFTKGYLFNDDNALLTNTMYVNHQGIVIGKVTSRSKTYVDINLSKNIVLQDGLRVLGDYPLGIKVSQMFVNKQLVTKGVAGQTVRINISNNVMIGDKVVKTSDFALFKRINERLRFENSKTNVSFMLYAYKDTPIRLDAYTSDNNIASVTGSVLAYSNNPLSSKRITEQLGKLSTSVFILEDVSIFSDYECFISISELNDLRRRAIDELTTRKHYSLPISNHMYSLRNDDEFIPSTTVLVDVVCNNKIQEEVCSKFNNVITYTNNIDYANRLSNDTNSIIVHNLNQLSSNNQIASFYANVVNKKSIEVLSDLGIHNVYLGLELSKDRIISLLEENYLISNLGVMVYGRVELMASKHCIVGKVFGSKNKNCGKCLENTFALEDEYHNKYPLKMSKESGCIMSLLSNNVINLTNHISSFVLNGCRRLLVVLEDESKEEVCQLLENINNAINDESFHVKKSLYEGYLNKDIE